MIVQLGKDWTSMVWKGCQEKASPGDQRTWQCVLGLQSSIWTNHKTSTQTPHSNCQAWMWRGKDLGLSNIVQHKLLQSILKTNVRLSLQHLRFGLNWQVTTEWVKKKRIKMLQRTGQSPDLMLKLKLLKFSNWTFSSPWLYKICHITKQDENQQPQRSTQPIWNCSTKRLIQILQTSILLLAQTSIHSCKDSN